MKLFDKFKNQFRGVIHWENPLPEQLFYKFTVYGDEIKDLSNLIVGPGQGCIFVYEGKVEQHITEEGKYSVKSDNVPFFTTLEKIFQRFESEHKTGIWFYRRADVLNCKWGTSTPIKYIDPVYQFPVNLSMYGNYSFRISNPISLFQNVVGSKNTLEVDDIRRIISERLIQPVSDCLANAKFSYGDIDANRTNIVENFKGKNELIFEDLGFQLIDFRIEGTGFDEDTLNRISKIADMTAENLAAKEVGLDYTQVQQLGALRDAAKNEGLAGAGLQMGAGFQLGNMVMQQSNQQQQQQNQNEDIAPKLQKLKELFEQGLITENEYNAKKTELLEKL